MTHWGIQAITVDSDVRTHRIHALGQCQATVATRNLPVSDGPRDCSGRLTIEAAAESDSRAGDSGSYVHTSGRTVQLNYVMNLFLTRKFIAWNNKLNYHEIKNHTIPWNTAAVKVVEIALTLASWSLFDDHCLTDIGSRSESSCQCAARASR